MINEQDDLSEFSDYLEQFEEVVKFDSETCPVCGIDLSSKINVESSSFRELIKINSEPAAKEIHKYLSEDGIRVIVEKRISGTLNKIGYDFVILVPFNRLKDARDKLKLKR